MAAAPQLARIAGRCAAIPLESRRFAPAIEDAEMSRRRPDCACDFWPRLSDLCLILAVAIGRAGAGGINFKTIAARAPGQTGTPFRASGRRGVEG